MSKTEIYKCQIQKRDSSFRSYGSVVRDFSFASLRLSPQKDLEAQRSFAYYDDEEDFEDAELNVEKEKSMWSELSVSSTDSTTNESLRESTRNNLFRDGKRSIDYVIVYEETKKKNVAEKNVENRHNLQHEKKLTRHLNWRRKFIASLSRIGVEYEEESEEGINKRIIFLKLSATWSVLCHYAEELSMRAPLQAHNNPATNWTEDLLTRFRIPNIMADEVPNKPQDFFTCSFKQSKIHKFLGSRNHDTYFTNTQRSKIVHEVLSTACYGKRKKGEIGIDRLIREGVFQAAFPLHDGPYEVKSIKDSTNLNARQVLYHYWARYAKWYKYQPLDHIRDYFGEKVGIYFAWLGFYTAWLLPASIVGLLVFMYGLLTINLNTPANEICERRGVFKMCPLCDESLGCKPWDLNDICAHAKISYLFDHPGTVFYAVFISFWAVTFLEYWKRKSASLAHHWDCFDFHTEEERPRPEFAAKAPRQEKNPITGVQEPYFPPLKRHKRMFCGTGVIFLMMTLVFIFIVAVIIYRVLVSIPLFQNDSLRAKAQAISSLSGAIVNFTIIMLMGRVYEKLALRLTIWEMHRTQTEFEDNLTFKVFIFQFVNFYSSIFYIAFFKGRFVGYPGHYQHIMFGLRNEDCSSGGCLIELAQQLAVIMIGKQIVNNAQEILWPKFKGWWHKKQVKLRSSTKSRWHADYKLIENEGLFQEYLEMVLQFGFITIFVAAFPLAPLFALLNNWVEIRLDAKKFVCETRRTVAERAQNIGIWFTILDFMAHLAVISNGFLIAFTSDFIPRLLYKYEYDWDLKGYINSTLSFAPNATISQECRYRGYREENGNHTLFFWRLLAIRFGFVILFEHVVFGICRLIDILVPDVPTNLEVKIKRERYLAKQALADSENILQVVQGTVERTDMDEQTDQQTTAYAVERTNTHTVQQTNEQTAQNPTNESVVEGTDKPMTKTCNENVSDARIRNRKLGNQVQNRPKNKGQLKYRPTNDQIPNKLTNQDQIRPRSNENLDQPIVDFDQLIWKNEFSEFTDQNKSVLNQHTQMDWPNETRPTEERPNNLLINYVKDNNLKEFNYFNSVNYYDGNYDKIS